MQHDHIPENVEHFKQLQHDHVGAKVEYFWLFFLFICDALFDEIMS